VVSEKIPLKSGNFGAFFKEKSFVTSSMELKKENLVQLKS